MMNQKSAITLLNTTKHPAQIKVTKGDLVIVFMPSLKPGQTVVVPTTDTYDVVASTTIDGNTYSSAPMTVTSATSFLARVVQDYSQGTYVFDVQQSSSTDSSQMQFQSSWRDTVTFTLSKDGKTLQNVVCADAFNMQLLQLGDTFTFQAIVDGVTTDIQESDDPNTVCTAVNDTTMRNAGFYTINLA